MKAALAPLLGLALVAGSAHTALADGWWEACSEREGGACNNADGSCAVSCDTAAQSSSKRALHVGTGLAMLAFVGYRIGRKRRRK